MQRLFSTFADGWPGVGLLLQRVLTATLLVRFGNFALTKPSFASSSIPQIIGMCLGMLLLMGLWTPIVGGLVAAIEVWIIFTYAGAPWIPIVIATLGGTIAMIGPGALSLDARLFGRKHIQT